MYADYRIYIEHVKMSALHRSYDKVCFYKSRGLCVCCVEPGNISVMYRA
jgi:hypothetical protein